MSKLWGPTENSLSDKAQWLHDQLTFQLQYGFKDLRGYAINQGPIKIIEYPELAKLTGGKRIENRVYVNSLYAWVYMNKGINEDSHEIVKMLAMIRIFKTPIVIPTMAEIMGIQTKPQANY